MEWKDIGNWLKSNAGTGAALVGSLLTGNIPGAVAAGVALVSGATGEAEPDKAMKALQQNPDALLKLRELAFKNEESIRNHIESMTKLELEDKQKEHEETQKTIRSADNSADPFVRRTRPAQSWLSLFGALAYVFFASPVSMPVLIALLTLPWTYAGLRQVGKGIDAFTQMKAVTGAKK